MAIVIQLIIVLLVVGFIYMIWLKMQPLIATVIAEPFLSIINLLVWILIAGIVLFYVIIPLLLSLGNMPAFRLPRWN